MSDSNHAPAETRPSLVRVLLTVLAGCLFIAGLVFAASRIPRPRDEAPTARPPRPNVEAVRVDDTVDPFAHIKDEELPEGGAKYPERLANGESRHAVRFTLREGETIPALKVRARQWLDSIHLPSGARFGLATLTDDGAETGVARAFGVRTYILTGAPIFETNDIVEAIAAVEPDDSHAYVSIALSPDASERFEAATAASIGRRIAIVIDGEINAAPVVQSKIVGGRISVTMGSGNPDKQLADAKKLAQGLTPR